MTTTTNIYHKARQRRHFGNRVHVSALTRLKGGETKLVFVRRFEVGSSRGGGDKDRGEEVTQSTPQHAAGHQREVQREVQPT